MAAWETPHQAFLVLVRDAELADAVAGGLRSRLAAAGRETPVLVPPPTRVHINRLAAWWRVQRTGVELASATLVIIDGAELAGLGRKAYVAVPPYMEAGDPDGAVVPVPTADLRGLIDAVLPGEAPVGSGTRSLWGRTLRAAALTGVIGVGGWLLTAGFQAGPAQAETVHHHKSIDTPYGHAEASSTWTTTRRPATMIRTVRMRAMPIRRMAIRIPRSARTRKRPRFTSPRRLKPRRPRLRTPLRLRRPRRRLSLPGTRRSRSDPTARSPRRRPARRTAAGPSYARRPR